MELKDKFENSSKIKIQRLRLKNDQVFFDDRDYFDKDQGN